MTRSGPASVVRRVAGVAGVGVVIVLALVAILTALRTELPTVPGVQSDALGPESGERVDDYAARAAASLEGGGDGARWALVTADAAWSVPEAAAAVRELPRVSGLYVQVPVPGVAMPVTGATLAEPPAGESDREAVFGRGVDQVIAQQEAAGAPANPAPDAPDRGAATAAPDRGAATAEPDRGAATAAPDRGAATAALTVSRLRAGEPGIIGMLVRGALPELRAVAEQPGVRAVEALPADAVWERFAVRPLQPQQTESASPLPDDAPVPPA